MATTVIKTVKSAGGDYTSISAWEAGEQANLVTLDQIREADCYSFTDTTELTVLGWTTDATRYPLITVPATERHTGTWDGTKYNLSTSGAVQDQINISQAFTRIQGIQLTWAGTSASRRGIEIAGYNGVQIESCIIKTTATAGTGTGILASSGTGTAKIWNNLIYDLSVTGSYGIYCSQGTNYCYSNTLVNCDTGIFRSLGTAVAKNVLTQNCVDGFGGTFDASSNYNLSDLASDAPGANSKNSTVVSFVNSAGKNFHLADTDSGAKNAGTDLSGDANLAFSNDIDGDTRVAPWDIGADENLSQTVSVSGMPPGFAAGTLTIVLYAAPLGINSGEVFGSPTTVLTVTPAGIGSGEQFGTATFLPGIVAVAPAGILSGESVGNAIVTPGTVTIYPTGILSGEFAGNAIVAPGVATVFPAGINSGESVGSVTVAPGTVTVSPTSILPGESVGNVTVVPGAATVYLTGISSGEVVGSLTIVTVVSPIGILSGETVSNVTVTVGGVAVSPIGISSGESVGSSTVTPGGVTVSPSGIVSGETVGSISVHQTVYPAGTASSEVEGVPTLVVGTVTVYPPAIPSAEVVGSPAMIELVVAAGITSAEVFGAISLIVQATAASKRFWSESRSFNGNLEGPGTSYNAESRSFDGKTEGTRIAYNAESREYVFNSEG